MRAPSSTLDISFSIFQFLHLAGREAWWQWGVAAGWLAGWLASGILTGWLTLLCGKFSVCNILTVLGVHVFILCLVCMSCLILLSLHLLPASLVCVSGLDGLRSILFFPSPLPVSSFFSTLCACLSLDNYVSLTSHAFLATSVLCSSSSPVCENWRRLTFDIFV